jgi:hypothetical protein
MSAPTAVVLPGVQSMEAYVPTGQLVEQAAHTMSAPTAVVLPGVQGVEAYVPTGQLVEQAASVVSVWQPLLEQLLHALAV